MYLEIATSNYYFLNRLKSLASTLFSGLLKLIMILLNLIEVILKLNYQSLK